tara:strand:+ start:262 stop:1737 length:1476 start_codon:yes stop_codon:yes gene_type:complete
MKNILGLLIFISIVIFSACHKDPVIKDSGVSLRFSSDTVYLDTVFATVGSSTYTLKVFNPEDEIIEIDNIRLEKNTGYYRININGIASNSLNNVQILPKDSIYIFIEISPGGAIPNEIVFEDKILFNNKGLEQSVQLVTLVWDAEFHYPTDYFVLGESPNTLVIPYSIINCDETWTSAKRHVIYGYALINEGCELNIDPGTEVFFHQNSGLWVFNGGVLNIAKGFSADFPDSVVFSGDRLEPGFENNPGQWGGIFGGIFIDDSARAVINKTVIRNANNSIRLDTAQFSDQLTLTNSYILNSSRTAIYGGFGNINAENVIIANSGLYSFYAFGGNYRFVHCTFANYWGLSTRTTPSVVLSNYLDLTDNNGNGLRVLRPLQSAYFGNCIIFGNNQQELSILEDNREQLTFNFNHGLFKLNTDLSERGFDVNSIEFINPLVNLEPGFKNVLSNNYGLDSSSQAVDQGNFTDIITLDILGNPRNNPDLGAIERVP